MTKKNASLLSMISLFVYCIFSFMPCIVTVTYWKASTPGVGIYSSVWSELRGVFGEGTIVWAVVLLVIAVVGIVAMACHYAGKEIPYLKYASFAPAATGVVFIILSIVIVNVTTPNGTPAGTATLGYYGYFAYEFAWGYYLAAALVLVGCVFGYLVAFGQVKDEEPVKNVGDSAKKVLQLKELMDAGAITQEEFEQKKKELLGL
ncbi:MAG: SHOCT domain-containing protein [Oscillospiraceae bacterium]|nr:SHOCT domain-containing protein [Oscillospiraceae bacterium]